MTTSTVLDKLRARLSPTQRKLLNSIAAYEENNPAGMPTIAINSNLELDEAQLEAALNPLGGDVVFSSGSDHVLQRFRLTFLGFLLTDQGEELENLFVRYFEYRRGVLTADPERGKKVDLEAAIAECGFSASQGKLFKRTFYSSRFHGSGGGNDTNLPPHAEQWYRHPDLRRYVHEQVAGTYDEKTPINPDQQATAPGPVAYSAHSSKAKILVFSANPLSTDRLSLDEEIRAITEKIRSSEHRDSIELACYWATRPDDLLQGLNEHEPQIIHFSGHGSHAGIILNDAQGQPKPVKEEALANLFKIFTGNLQVVLLNACYSRTQAEAIVEHVPCAIGLPNAIEDSAAIIFAASFYRGVGFGRSVQEAFDQGVAALQLEGVDQGNTPELLVRSGADPTKIFPIQTLNVNGSAGL